MTNRFRNIVLLGALSLGITGATEIAYPAYFLIKKATVSAPADLAWTDTVSLNVKSDSAKYADTALFCKTGGGSSDTAKYAKKADSARASHISDTAKKSGWSKYADSARASKISDSSKVLGSYARITAIHDTATQLRAYALARIHDSLSALDSVAKAHISDSSAYADTTRASWKADSAHIAFYAHASTYADSSRVSGLADSAKHAPPSAFADSSRASHKTDSASWAPLDTGRVRGIVSDTAAALRSNMAGYLPLTGGTLTGFLTGTSAELWTNINAHDYGPALTLHGSIYTSDANLLLRSSSGYGNCVGFSDQSKSVGFQRWNLGVENDIFQIQANSVSDGPGGESALKLDRNGNLTILGTLTAFSFTGNTSTATKLQTARTIATSGDVTGTPTNFDGTANITIPTTLPTLLTAGSAGSAAAVPTLTWDAKGRLTAVGSAAISIPHTQISDWAASVSSVYLPLAGGTMSGNLLGGTPYNIGATSNWWGSIYATTIYESNVALSSKYLGVNGTASNAAALGGKSPSWYLPGGQYFIPGAAGAPDYTLLFTVVFSSQYQGFNNEVYISGRFDASRYSIAIGNDANTANVYVSKFGSPIVDAGRIKYIVTNTSSYHNTVKVYLVRLSWDYTTDYSFGSSTGSYDSYAENSSPTPTTTDPGVTAPTLSTFGYNTIANTVTAAGGFVGSLTGHASLDIPLTGSSAITGSLDPIGSTYSVGSSNAPWGEIHARAIAAHTIFYGNRLESTGNTLSLVGGTSVAINVGNSNLLNISNSSTTIYNPVALSNTFTPAVITPSGAVTIDATYQGKMVSTGCQVNLPTTGPFVGFWFYLSWYHDAYQGWGPPGVWIFRGVSTTGTVADKFSGIVSWTGSEWIAG